MNLYTVCYSKKFDMDLDRLAKSGQKYLVPRILKACAVLATGRSPGLKKIEGRDDAYRIRVGDYRILFSVDSVRHIVLVERVAHRKDVYRP